MAQWEMKKHLLRMKSMLQWKGTCQQWSAKERTNKKSSTVNNFKSIRLKPTLLIPLEFTLQKISCSTEFCIKIIIGCYFNEATERIELFRCRWRYHSEIYLKLQTFVIHSLNQEIRDSQRIVNVHPSVGSQNSVSFVCFFRTISVLPNEIGEL